MEEKLFLIEFEYACGGGCSSDIELRLCKAKNHEEAFDIAFKHRNKFYKEWMFSVRDIEWYDDGTAYIYSNYS